MKGWKHMDINKATQDEIDRIDREIAILSAHVADLMDWKKGKHKEMVDSTNHAQMEFAKRNHTIESLRDDQCFLIKENEKLEKEKNALCSENIRLIQENEALQTRVLTAQNTITTLERDMWKKKHDKTVEMFQNAVAEIARLKKQIPSNKDIIMVDAINFGHEPNLCKLVLKNQSPKIEIFPNEVSITFSKKGLTYETF